MTGCGARHNDPPQPCRRTTRQLGRSLSGLIAQALTREFGRGFDAFNLRYMRLFYNAFPIRDALRHELSWTHYRQLRRVDSAQ